MIHDRIGGGQSPQIARMNLKDLRLKDRGTVPSDHQVKFLVSSTLHPLTYLLETDNMDGHFIPTAGLIGHSLSPSRDVDSTLSPYEIWEGERPLPPKENNPHSSNPDGDDVCPGWGTSDTWRGQD